MQLDPDTGATVTDFTADTDARATELAVSGSTVYVGGRFGKVNGTVRKSLAAVDALTGAVDAGFVNDLSGGIGVNGGLTVQKLLLTHDGSKLLVIHTGRQINGQDRYGIGMIDTATKQLLPWRTRLWDDNLQFVGGIQRIISGSISPDDSWFVVSSGSGGDRPPINDTVVAYPMNGGNDVQPTWISRAFDSVYTTAISEKAVYIGGHFAWNESPSAPDPFPGAADVGYGTGQGLSGYGLGDSVVGREHLGALNPEDGKALEWNPGSNSNIGNTSMALTPRGLITGGDATTQGASNVGSVAFFDFDSVEAPNGVETTITTPIAGRVLPAAHDFTIEGTATAPTGVRKVFVELQNRTTGQWLQSDKTTWGGAANFEATVTPTSATEATWSVTLNVPANIKMLARARAQGNAPAAPRPEDPTKAIKKFETFSLDDAPPTLTYAATPAAGLLTSTTFTVSGTASDDFGVAGISMTLRDAAGRYLQDDGTADATYNAIGIVPDVPNATSTTWSKEVTVPTEGTWQAQARARDTKGNSSLDSHRPHLERLRGRPGAGGLDQLAGLRGPADHAAAGDGHAGQQDDVLRHRHRRRHHQGGLRRAPEQLDRRVPHRRRDLGHRQRPERLQAAGHAQRPELRLVVDDAAGPHAGQLHLRGAGDRRRGHHHAAGQLGADDDERRRPW